MTMADSNAIFAAANAVAVTMTAVAVHGNVRLRRRLRVVHAELQESRLAALRDALTGLTNRAGIDAHLTMRAAAGEPVWLLLVDLDGFKPVNDVHTHAAGDVVLAEVARRLSHVTGAHLVGRFGGDEFIIVSEVGTAAAAGAVARDVLAVLRKPITVADDVHVRISASVGGVQMRPGDDPGAALHSADFAMYQAKDAGGGRAVAFDRDELLEPGERPPRRRRDIHPQRVPGADLDEWDPV
jgi:diguanylate cyclase (GGDEF)-like protein